MLAQYYDVSSRELESFGLEQVAQHFGVADKEAADGRTALSIVRETQELAAALSRSYFIQAQIFRTTTRM